MKWSNPIKKVPEGWQDEFGFHLGRPPVPDITEAVFGRVESEPAPIPQVKCSYCGKTMGWHEGLIIGALHFHTLHCYVLWENQKERPVRQAKLFKKTLL